MPNVPGTLPNPSAPRQTSDLSAGFSHSLERGLSLLDAFACMSATLGIAEIAREVGLNKSTTHRYVNTLTVLGYLHQDPESRKYRLGARAVEIGFAALNSIE